MGTDYQVKQSLATVEPVSGEEVEEDVTLVIRVIRSFPHRNIRNIVLRNVNSHQTVGELLEVAKRAVQESSNLPPPFRKFQFDCLKVEHQAHGSKPSDPVINPEGDVLESGISLTAAGVKNETELSLFRLSDYEEYKGGPSRGQTRW